MAICDLVENIIQERHAKLPFIEKKKSELNEMKSLLHEFEAFKKRIVDADGNPIDGPFKDIADRNPDMVFNLSSLSTGECERKIEAALAECENAYNRFSRESVNIAVIGRAGVGKSAFLQGISNLQNEVIPSYADTDCTGAVSVIHNKPGTEFEAVLTFNSEDEMIHIVQDYLDKIITDESKRIRIYSIGQIKNLKREDIQNKMEEGDAAGSMLDSLMKYADGYDQWIECVHKSKMVLYNKSEIQQYVAQNNGIPEGKKGRQDYYKYLAVKNCEISCTFDYAEAGKITLLDTVGLGDTALGIEHAMISTVKDKSDAVVFMIKPQFGDARQKGGVDQYITDIYKMVYDECKDKRLDKWLFWLINLVEGKNDYQCGLAKKKIISNNWNGKIKEIVNVINKDQLRNQFLIPLLEMLIDNLEDIDELYLTDLKNALTDVKDAYSVFCQSAKKLMDSEYKNDPEGATQIEVMIYAVINRITQMLKELAKNEMYKRETPCKELKAEIDRIINKLRNEGYLPKLSKIKEELRSAQAQALYIEYCNKIRTDITQDFAAVDTSLQKLVAAMKNSIANILIPDDGGRLGRILKTSDEQPYEWIEIFADNVLIDAKSFPNIYPAFKNVQNFDFSVKGFLTYEVRACLDCLDPDLTNIPDIVGGDEAENIRFWLDKNLLDVSDLLTDRLYELLNKPNRAFFAFIKEFNDKVIYGNESFDFGDDSFVVPNINTVVLEWKKLYYPNRFVVWPDAIKKLHSDRNSFEKWAELLKKLLELNSRTQLTIR